MIELAPERIAAEAGRGDRPPRAGRAARARGRSTRARSAPGDLFFGLRGEHADGGEFAAAALAAGAWGVVVEPERGRAARGRRRRRAGCSPPPTRCAALQALARAWRRELGCPVVGITGSTGKTSVKDICRAILPFRVHASPENFNTEIGLPLALLAAPPETEVLVLEMAMRGLGQIAELCEIAEPDVAAITNVGPVHLELLGTLEAIAEAKAEILAGLARRGPGRGPGRRRGARARTCTSALSTITFGPGGDVFAPRSERRGHGLDGGRSAPRHGEASSSFPFTEAPQPRQRDLRGRDRRRARRPARSEMARRAPGISFSRLRGELIELPGGAVLVNDCYNANPISMRAALDHLASLEVAGRGDRGARRDGRARPRRAPATTARSGPHARGLGIGADRRRRRAGARLRARRLGRRTPRRR